jgi:hypothetical protein
MCTLKLVGPMWTRVWYGFLCGSKRGPHECNYAYLYTYLILSARTLRMKHFQLCCYILGMITCPVGGGRYGLDCLTLSLSPNRCCTDSQTHSCRAEQGHHGKWAACVAKVRPGALCIPMLLPAAVKSVLIQPLLFHNTTNALVATAVSILKSRAA